MSIKEDVKKDFGSDILLSANSIIDRKLVTIPVSPALDIILNGGIPEGSFVIFTGHPKCETPKEPDHKVLHLLMLDISLPNS